MFLKRIGNFLHCLVKRLNFFKRSSRKDTLLDTIKLSLFGLKIEITRELPANCPHELTVVVPRAELRKNHPPAGINQAGLEALLNSITVAHSPRFEPQNT